MIPIVQECRLFLTSYQKSGTHQIMPALEIGPNIVDKSRSDLIDLPSRYGTRFGREVNQKGVELTCEELRTFEDKSFGHVSYLPEYAQAVQAQPTRVLFNVRDPRDIIVAEYFSSKRGNWPDLYIQEYGVEISLLDDPISELIEVASCRWPKWLGWLDHDFVMKVKYEDLRLNSEETARQIVSFIAPYKVYLHTVIERLKPRPKNPTFRKGIPGEWRETFTDEHKKKAELMLGNIIEKLGYEI